MSAVRKRNRSMAASNGHAPSVSQKRAAAQTGDPEEPWLFGERTSDGVDEPCRLRLGEGYEVREDAARSRGLRGAAPDKQRAVFAAAETARKAKWVPLCPACHVCYVCKFGLKITLLS